MIRSLYSGATGMYAQQMNIDNISNNLANVNTNAFKKTQLHFEDLLYQTVEEAGSVKGDGMTKPVELSIGVGVKPVDTQKVFSGGSLNNTGNSLDIAIDGEGFFTVKRGDGTSYYTRDGAFRMSEEGKITTSDGYYLDPEVTLPADTESVSISPDGIISVKQFGSDSTSEVGQIQLARFINPAGLKSVGGNRYTPTPASGDPMIGNPGNVDMGTTVQGYLETSNVQVVEEMVNMIVAQRAYELNSKSVRTAEAMLETAINIKR